VRIDVGDAELFFDVEGAKVVAADDAWIERPTVVLLHAGPGADHSLYKDLVGPRLASIAQVVYLDQRGDGRSSRSDASHWNLEAWSDDLGVFLDALEIERPVLVGSAIGSLVALSFASRYPERPAALVLVSAVARYVHQRSVSEFDRLGGAHAGEVAARYFGDPSEGTFADYMNVCLPLYTRRPLDPDVIARMRINPEATINWTRVEAGKVDLREAVGRIACPVLLLAGEDDPSFTVAGAEELAEALPADLTTFLRIPVAGHGVFRDAPWALDEAAAFIRANGR
jgi:pimeloyl-ACP methyl ester carboxylesterase